MKKKLFAILALLVIITVVTAGTWAYFTGQATAHNVITAGNIDIELVETMLDGDKEVAYVDPDTGLMPGGEVSKIVRVHNAGENAAWVRVKVNVEINGRKVDPTAEDAVLVIAMDDTKWEKHGAYYYYTEPLKDQGDKTIPLFEEVELLSSADNSYQNAEIEIGVTAEGIQVQNNELAKGKSITSVWPKGVEILAYPFRAN